MSSPRPLVPPSVAARGHSQGWLSFGFGPRVFVALLLGFLWLVPAWWLPQLIAAMILWDILVVVTFIADLSRLPKAAQLEGCRTWEHAPSLATACEVTLALRNFGDSTVRCNLVDETPASLRAAPPSLAVIVPAGQRASARYTILPRERGDIRLGRLYLRYQGKLGFAERWAAVEISQSIRVLPDLEQ